MDLSKGRRKRVFLTGATGTWGRRALAELAQRSDRFDVVALVLPSERDHDAIRGYEGMDHVTVVLGDLTDYPAVESCVRDCDYVVHIGAVVSPLADDHPELTHRVNVGGAHNIIRAVRAQPDADLIGVVMVGSVAETGDRNPPHHWGRVGDPLRVARYDEYGQSKVAAERALVDSGLNRWVWLRQTGIFHPGILEIRDPIMTHSPFGGVMEWVSVRDAARLVANICEDGVPAEFWGGIYNVGGGDGWRLTNWELQTRVTGALGVPDVRRWYDRHWFASRNFHGHWYTDSDRLEQLVAFRRETFDEALAEAVRDAPRSLRIAGRIPAWIVKHLVVKPLTRRPRGTMAWIRDGDDERIRAFFGSRAEWDRIGDWTTFEAPRPPRVPTSLDHGYDEGKLPAEWTTRDLRDAADFRGGQLLSETMTTGDIRTPLRWRCSFGHTFSGSPRLILSGGHWCPDCVRAPAEYARQAESNRFLAQLETSAMTAATATSG